MSSRRSLSSALSVRRLPSSPIDAKKFPTGRKTVVSPRWMGATTATEISLALTRGPPSPWRKSRVITIIERAMKTSSNNRPRPLRRYMRYQNLLYSENWGRYAPCGARITPLRDCSLMPGGADEDPLEGLELLETLARPDRDREKGVLGDVDRHPRLVLESLV